MTIGDTEGKNTGRETLVMLIGMSSKTVAGLLNTSSYVSVSVALISWVLL